MIHKRRMFELIELSRRRGKLLAVGGPFVVFQDHSARGFSETFRHPGGDGSSYEGDVTETSPF